MILSLHKALIGLLKDAGWDAYAEDCVPPDAAFPLVTCRSSVPLTHQSRGEAVLTVWTKGDDASLERLALAARLLGLFPQGGSLLVLEDCVAALFPAEDKDMDWPAADGALGARFRLEVSAFPSHKGG